MNEGNNEKIKGAINLGILSSGISLNGPIIKEKAGFSLSLRRTYIDAITAINQRNNDEKSNYYFYDVNGKINFSPNPRNRFYLSSYFGRDKYYTTFNYIDVKTETSQRTETLNDENNAIWGNLTASFRWNYLISSKLFSNLTFSYTNYTFDVNMLRNNRFNNMWSSLMQRYRSGIQDYSLKIDFDYYHNNGNISKFGINNIYHYFYPRIDLTEGTDDVGENYQLIEGDPIIGWENHFYYENDFNIGTKFNTNLGARAIVFTSANKNYYSFEPRISSRYMINNQNNIRGSVCSMSQYVHMLNSSNISLPTDLWLPITDKIPPMKALQTTLGYDFFFGKKWDYSINIDVYYKILRNIISYKESSSFFD
jgi:hypothetical protein